MSRREDIDNSVWSDPDFHALSPNAKLVYLWSFTNPRCGMAGIYKTVPAAIALETGLTLKAVDAVLDELHTARFVLHVHDVLWVRTRIKHLRTKSIQMARSIEGDLERVGDEPLRRLLIEEYKGTAWAYLREVLLRVARTSPEGHENVSAQAKSGGPHPNVTGTSVEVPGQGQGSSEQRPVAHAREAAADLEAAQRRLKSDADELPDDLPQRLHDPARQVQQRLLRLHGRKPRSLYPSLAAVGRVLASMPDRDHVSVADDVEHYWTFGSGQNRSMRDLVATYRNRVATAPVVANGATASDGIDDIVARAEQREARLEAQRRDREASAAGARS